MAQLTPRVDVRRAGDRFTTDTGWWHSEHSFSYADHYDPGNTHHGLLAVNNDDRLATGTGFDPHPHRDMEIVTWVLDGSLVHRDSTGGRGLIRPGLAQAMSAGTGVQHSESNDAPRSVHYVQMWVVPDEVGRVPGYQQADIAAELRTGERVPVASGLAGRDAAVRINAQAALYAARLPPGGSVTLPDAAYLHLFVPRGTVTVEGAGALGPGDAVRFTATGGQRVTADAPAEVLVWEMHAAVGE